MEPLVKFTDPIQVPCSASMDDETFLKHLEYRHAEECKFEDTPVARRAVDAWIGAYRAFHDRLHKIAVPGQYDHYHEDDDDEDVPDTEG